MLKTQLRHLLNQANALQAEAWFECLNLSEEDGIVRVVFPHAYFGLWFSQHKRDVFEATLRQYFSRNDLPRIIYTHKDNAHQEHEPASDAFSQLCHTDREGEEQDAEDIFASFITNAKNAFPLGAAREIAKSGPGLSYNPFLLCGHSGTGKTHLLRALAASFTRRDGSFNGKGRIICQSAARFCAESAPWARRPELFWQQCDALLLDDLQELAGQTAWQQKLSACMDACPPARQGTLDNSSQASAQYGLRCGPRQMVFAHTGTSQALKNLDERLRSRLESGLVVELLEPDLDVRLRYLQALCKERHISLAREQLLHLAQRCTQFRLLQGLLLKIEAFSSMNGRSPTPADLENIVRTGGADKPSGCREILGEVARDLNLRPEDILGAKRRPDLVLARQVAMYLCRQKLGLSYPELGRAFGGRDHSTVIHAIKKIKKLLVSDKDVQRLVAQLETNAL